jgi:hypothetical protein
MTTSPRTPTQKDRKVFYMIIWLEGVCEHGEVKWQPEIHSEM